MVKQSFCTLLYSLTAALFLNGHSVSANYVIAYPTTVDGLSDYRIRYYLELLQLGADKMGLELVLQPRELTEMRDDRALEELEKGHFNLYWMATNTEREQRLRPIRVPLYKGLIGWRIGLVNTSRLNIFSNLESLDEIKNMTALQGNDWPDADVLIANGYKVRRSSSWSGMFEQISLNRQDYFPRGVTEIYSEIAARSYLKIAAEPSVVFTYPSAYYLFTNKENEPLALLLEHGLIKAIKDGSFDEVFLKHFGPALEQADLKNRTRIRLINPNLPPNTPLDNPLLWYEL